jgi:hypothetical protein
MEEFVTYEIAVKLKEKGFTKPCRFYYSGSSVFPNQRFQLLSRNTTEDNSLDAPTISQVFKWLREEKKIHISILTFMFKEGWCYEITSIEKYPKFITTQRSSSNTYEEAELLGIEYVLDNLI